MRADNRGAESDPDERLVHALIAMGEGRTVELKESLPPLSTPAGKAEFAKDVLALANSVTSGERAYLLYGVRDPSRGGEIVGLEAPPSAEAIAQILAEYIAPPPRTTFRVLEQGGRRVGVLEITGGNLRPHHAAREYPAVLNPSIAYVRRDRVNGAATSREVEEMLMQRLGRPGRAIDQSPLKVGFVGRGFEGDNKTLLVRITNTAESSVAGIEVLVDFQHIGLAALVARRGVFINMTLAPGESREAEVRAYDLPFMLRTVESGYPPWVRVTAVPRGGAHVGDGWLNATLRVHWRESDGFIHTMTRELAVEF